MEAELDTDLLTMAEAAKLLKVSTVTLKRWLKQGRLPAYHVGPRAIRIRRADLAKVMTPVSGEEVRPVKESHPIHSDLPVRPLTDEEVAAALEALQEAKVFTERMRARRGGRPLAPSWELLRQAREERATRS